MNDNRESQLAADALAAKPPGDQVPEGWRTVAEIAVAEGYSRVYANQLLNRCVAAGTWERQTFRVRTERGMRATCYYRRSPDAP